MYAVRKELIMSGNKRTTHRIGMAFGLAVLGLAAVWVLMASQTLAQAPLDLDGVGDDWDPGWLVVTDALDVAITGPPPNPHPHDSPTFARSGYDAIGLWAHYDVAGETWVFRLDVDGRVGDSDSVTGTSAISLGVGTHGPDGDPDGRPLGSPVGDGEGIGNNEAYWLIFRYESGGSVVAELGGDPTILPGVVTTTTGDLAGQAIYSTTVPGVTEWAFDRETILPATAPHWQLWAGAHIGDSSDIVSEDDVASTLLIAHSQRAQCAASPIVVGDEATFPLTYTIPSSAALGVSDAVLAVDVPTGTTFLGASAGGVESGGVITWPLAAYLAPGDAGQVTFDLRVDDALTLTIHSEMTCAEGLRYQATVECPVQQPTPTPTPTATPTSTPTATPTSTPTATPTPSTPTPTPTRTPTAPPGPPGEIPEPATVSLLLGGLVGLAGYVTMRRRTRRQT